MEHIKRFENINFDDIDDEEEVEYNGILITDSTDYKQLKVGDIINFYYKNEIYNAKIIEHIEKFNQFGIEFEININGHDCSYEHAPYGKNKHCWYCIYSDNFLRQLVYRIKNVKNK